MRLLRILFLCSCCFAVAQQDAATYFSVPPADAPELASRGPWAVGVRTVELVKPHQPDILRFDKDTGKAPVYDRPLTIEIWYPATIPPGKEERVVYEMKALCPAHRDPAFRTPFTFRVRRSAMHRP